MNKRLVIVFACLAVLVLIVVCGAIVFTVQRVDVLVAGDNANINKADIVASSKIKNGVSIFTIDEQEIINNIEKEVPYAKVANIERAFPNKIRISVEYRQAILAIKIAESNQYIIVDADLKILEMVTDIGDRNIIKVNNASLSIDSADDIVGNFVNQTAEKMGSIYSSIKGLAEVGISGDRFLAYVRGIDFDTNNMLIATSKGVNLLIRRNTNAKEDLQAKACYNYFNTKLTDTEREDSSYYIYVKNNGECVYSPTIDFN